MNQCNLIKNVEGLGSVNVIEPLSTQNYLTNNLLSEQIRTNTELVDQSLQRQFFANNLRNILQKQNSNQEITQQELSALYVHLSDFLEMDSNNCRILLYFPYSLFENELFNSQTKLKSLIESGFIRLLHESDIRANFVDGDVLDADLGIPERVRKVAHLIPILLKLEIIKPELLIDLLEISDEEELIKSLLEGILVASYNLVFSDTYLDLILEITSRKPIVDLIFRSLLKTRTQEIPIIEVPKTLEQILADLESDLTNLENKFDANSEYTQNISKARAKWEKQVERENLIETSANLISTQLLNSKLDLQIIANREGFDNVFLITTIKSIFIAAERLSYLNLENAKKLFEYYRLFLEHSAYNAQGEVKDTIISGLNYLVRLNVIDISYLSNYNLELTDLSLSQLVSSEELIRHGFNDLAVAAKKVEQHPELSKYIYPFVIGFGSRLKGYAGVNSDIDAAIFFKPQTPWEKREELINLLKQSIPEFANIDKILEFWLYQDDGNYGFRNVPQVENVIGPQEVHILLNSLWIGDTPELKSIYSSIVSKYYNLNRFGDDEAPIRTKFLRQLELDILQCRLMHKGYKRFYPKVKPIQSTYASLIDYTGDFWDEGYRGVASLLFLEKVFIPKIDTMLPIIDDIN